MLVALSHPLCLGEIPGLVVANFGISGTCPVTTPPHIQSSLLPNTKDGYSAPLAFCFNHYVPTRLNAHA